MQNERPDPDATAAQRSRRRRPRAAARPLRIYFGASAGVGKTYAMLAAARSAAQRRHGCRDRRRRDPRPQAKPKRCCDGLEILPLAELEYQGAQLTEFDLDAALARRPALILVDELAHTNAPGSRHPKRWQDVDELLASGHRRLHDAQRPAPREPERRRRRHHRHPRLGDGARHLLRRRRRGDAGRPAARRTARAAARRQGLRAGAGRARGRAISSARAI